MRFYTLYDKNIKLSNFPFDAPSDDYAIFIVSNSLEGYHPEVRERIIKNCDIYYCGSFNPKTGIFEDSNRRFVASCSDFSVVKKED